MNRVSGHMQCMRLAAAARLRDTRGFMLGEHVLSIVFLGLLCIAIAAGLSAALSSYAAITKQTKADAMLARAVEEVSDQLTYALSVEGSDARIVLDNPSFVSPSTKASSRIVSNDAGIVLTTLVNGKETALVPCEYGLIPKVENIEYRPRYDDYDEVLAGQNEWGFTVAVYEDSKTDAPLAETTMSILRIGS